MDAGQRRKKWDLRPRSLFGQIMITMVCFVLAFFALICVYFLYQNSRALEKHRVNSGTELLEQSVGTVDRMLDDLSLLLHSTLMSPDVIPLAISPDLRDFESMRTITEALTSSANTSTLIDAVYFYSSREDLGLSSDYTLSNYQDYSYAAVLARFQTRKHKLTPYEAHGTATYIYTENNDIYLIQGFSNIKYDQCSCYILFHLDSEQFRRTVNSTGDPMLLFFNSAGGRMFSPEEAGDWSEAVYQCAAQRESASGSFLHSWGSGKSSYIIYRTDALTGWLCAYVTQPVSTLAVRYLYSNVLLLLAVLFLGLACAAAIFRSARRISRPISELIQKMQASSGDVPAPDIQSEWEYLEHTYSSLLSRKKELEQYLPLAAESLHDQLFRAILRQEALEPERIGQQLDLIHSDFTPDTPCAVFLVSARPTDEEAPDQMSQELTILGLRDGLNRYMSGTGLPCHILVQHSAELCLVCGFPQAAARRWQSLKEELSLLGRERAALVWGMGGLTKDLAGLPDSLAEARNDLEFNQYYAKDAGGKHLRTVYIGEMRNLLGTIRREDAGRLLEAISKLLQDISVSFSGKEARQLYQLLLDLLLEQSAALKIDCGNMDVSLQSVPDDGLEPAMERICQELVRRLQGHFNSGQYMYIERAKEFILSRCGDPNLSLESVAEYVGINPTYLSRLFTSIAQQNFSVYLNQCRVDNAKRLLKSGDMTAQEIGYLTGFCSVATFFRVFKKHTGMTPKQFRQSIR